ncbi:MAG: glycerate kinase [Candidatus Hydrogenedentes bacterium]|nr:glycerate kinase [Candidatus Hydrogenedentota bacterium]
MKLLVAPDSFKECMDAFSVADAIARGLRLGIHGPLEVICRPLADGGEGLMRVLLHALGGETSAQTVTGPMGISVEASLGLLDNGRTAAIEMAAAAGLHLVPAAERDPLTATTRGVGELIRHALDLGVQRVIVGLGGSATNDGGAGMAQALGASLRDAAGNELPPGGAALARLKTVDLSHLDKRLAAVEIIGACDVENTLCGACGASAVYGPQKGATPENVALLDSALRHYGGIVTKETGLDLFSLLGGGAAGGLGAGLAAFTGARLRSGVSLVFDAYGDMDRQAQDADAFFSGEGSVDGQTLHGKVVAGVAGLARKHHKPLIVFAGRLRGHPESLYQAGVTAVFPIAPEPMSTADALANADTYLAQSAENVGRLLEQRLETTGHV